MRRSATFALRFLTIIMVLGLIPALFVDPGARHTPYLSALSSLAVPQAFATPRTCNFKACGGSRYNEACNPTSYASNCKNSKGFCIVSNC
jgi:hypothetical protein